MTPSCKAGENLRRGKEFFCKIAHKTFEAKQKNGGVSRETKKLQRILQNV